MAYTVHISTRASRQLKKLSRPVLIPLDRALRRLANQPRPPQSKKLQDTRIRGLYRLKVGDYRIVYQIKDKVLMILVVDVGDRKDIYKTRH